MINKHGIIIQSSSELFMHSNEQTLVWDPFGGLSYRSIIAASYRIGQQYSMALCAWTNSLVNLNCCHRHVTGKFVVLGHCHARFIQRTKQRCTAASACSFICANWLMFPSTGWRLQLWHPFDLLIDLLAPPIDRWLIYFHSIPHSHYWMAVTGIYTYQLFDHHNSSGVSSSSPSIIGVTGSMVEIIITWVCLKEYMVADQCLLDIATWLFTFMDQVNLIGY